MSIYVLIGLENGQFLFFTEGHFLWLDRKSERLQFYYFTIDTLNEYWQVYHDMVKEWILFKTEIIYSSLWVVKNEIRICQYRIIRSTFHIQYQEKKLKFPLVYPGVGNRGVGVVYPPGRKILKIPPPPPEDFGKIYPPPPLGGAKRRRHFLAKTRKLTLI